MELFLILCVLIGIALLYSRQSDIISRLTDIDWAMRNRSVESGGAKSYDSAYVPKPQNESRALDATQLSQMAVDSTREHATEDTVRARRLAMYAENNPAPAPAPRPAPAPAPSPEYQYATTGDDTPKPAFADEAQ